MNSTPNNLQASPFDEICSRLNRTFPAIEVARLESRQTESRIRHSVATVKVPPDIALVVFGSLARLEWTSGSDVDWTLLVDGPSDPEHFGLARDIEKGLEQAGFPPVGASGTFGSMASSFDLIHYIGGSEDSNQNMTRRILLLLESVSLSDTVVHERVLRGILKRYIQTDPAVSTATTPTFRVPLFLMNDIVRLWRTIAVDYATKKWQQSSDKWALRNVKLRMSRKLLFVKGLLMCFSCQRRSPRASSEREEIVLDQLVSHCLDYTGKSAIDALCEVLIESNSELLAVKLLQSYDDFLACLNDKKKRDHLKKLDFSKAATDELFQQVRSISYNFRDGLNELFFDHELLRPLTREFGLF
jgi:predicted nucleotidyltransferase